MGRGSMENLGVPVVNVSSRYGALNYRDNRMVGFNNIELITDRPLADNLREIEEVKKRFPDHAVIASLMVETRTMASDREGFRKCRRGWDWNWISAVAPRYVNEVWVLVVGQEPKVLKTIVSWVKEVAKVPVIVKLTPT